MNAKEKERVKQKAIGEVMDKHLKNGTDDEKIAFATLLENLLDSFMKGEREIFLDKDADNKGNGFYERTVATALGKLNLSVPRDREGEFRSYILPGPWSRTSQSYEDLMASLVVNGFSRANIMRTLKKLDLPYCEEELTKIEEQLTTRLEEFKTRELPKDAFCLFIDGYSTQIREKKGRIMKYCIYTVLGIDMEHFKKEVYGYYVFSGPETRQDWIKVFEDLIGRGLKRVLLVVSDDLSGLDNAISAIFEKTDHQLCFIHLQRNVRRHMSRKDAKEFNAKLKEIRVYSKDYEQAKDHLEELLEQYEEKYPTFIEYLDSKKEKYLSFIKYPEEIRKHIYTTNAVESFNALWDKIRMRLGGYFQSEQILGTNIMIQHENLLRGKWRKPQPAIAGCSYELNQMFRLRFEKE